MTIVISAGIASQAVERIGVKPALVFGLASIAVGLAWFSQVDADGSYVSDVLGPSIVAAIGLGFSFVPVTIAAVAGVRDDEAGLASGLVNTSQQVGGALGLAVLATIANSTTSGLPGGAQNPVALTEGFQDAFLVGCRLRARRRGAGARAAPPRRAARGPARDRSARAGRRACAGLAPSADEQLHPGPPADPLVGARLRLDDATAAEAA